MKLSAFVGVLQLIFADIVGVGRSRFVYDGRTSGVPSLCYFLLFLVFFRLLLSPSWRAPAPLVFIFYGLPNQDQLIV